MKKAHCWNRLYLGWNHKQKSVLITFFQYLQLEVNFNEKKYSCWLFSFLFPVGFVCCFVSSRQRELWRWVCLAEQPRTVSKLSWSLSESHSQLTQRKAEKATWIQGHTGRNAGWWTLCNWYAPNHKTIGKKVDSLNLSTVKVLTMSSLRTLALT